MNTLAKEVDRILKGGGKVTICVPGIVGDVVSVERNGCLLVKSRKGRTVLAPPPNEHMTVTRKGNSWIICEA
jgi:hypothetical protein